MTTYAGEIPTMTTIQQIWAPGYQYAVDSTSRTLYNGTAGTGIAAATFSDYTGQPSVTITVTATGVLQVFWGFEGRNTASASSTCRLGVTMSGANSVSPSTDLTACVCGNGAGASTSATKTSSRMHLYKNLSAGSTTIKLQGYISSQPGTNRDAIVDNAYLFVSQFYYDGTY